MNIRNITLAIGFSSLAYSSITYAETQTDSDMLIVNGDEPELGNYATPVILPIKEIESMEKMWELANEYIRKNFEGYTSNSRGFFKEDGKYLVVFGIRNDKGEKTMVYFDISDVLLKLSKSSNKKTQEEAKKLMDSYMDEK